MAKSNGLESWFGRVWMRRGPAACLLLPLSLLFGLLAWLRRAGFRAGLFSSAKLPVPVIVVGNIFIGGTGKTPFVIWLLAALRQAGFHPGVVSRGHGAHAEVPRSVDAASLATEVGDEPLLIATHGASPVVVGRRRAEAARLLLERFPEVNVIISDDGLQHYALQRDVEVVLSDVRGNGNGWLLPAGPLREPASRRRDFSVVNSADAPQAWRMDLVPGAVCRLDGSGGITLAALAGQNLRVAAAAGIGNPERFFAMLRAAGLRIDTMPLPDHFDFAGFSFGNVEADCILITEKDAVKCRHVPALAHDARLMVVPVAAQLDAALAAQIVEKLHGCAID
jgi:tetraacyldisaccharide 4'-kinase